MCELKHFLSAVHSLVDDLIISLQSESEVIALSLCFLDFYNVYTQGVKIFTLQILTFIIDRQH